jgi:hypothetical protein
MIIHFILYYIRFIFKKNELKQKGKIIILKFILLLQRDFFMNIDVLHKKKCKSTFDFLS